MATRASELCEARGLTAWASAAYLFYSVCLPPWVTLLRKKQGNPPPERKKTMTSLPDSARLGPQLAKAKSLIRSPNPRVKILTQRLLR